MSSVELADGKQVQRGDQHADPAGTVERVESDQVVRGQQRAEQDAKQRLAVLANDPVKLRIDRRRGRGCQADSEGNQRDDEARDRSRGGDVEQRLAIGYPAADPDHRSQRPQHEGSRDEKGQRGRDAVVAASQVMAHLVAEEYQKDPDRVRDPGGEDPHRELAKRRGRQELVSDLGRAPEGSPGPGQGDEREQHEDGVQQQPARRDAHRGRRPKRWRDGGRVGLRGVLHGKDQYSSGIFCPLEGTGWPPGRTPRVRCGGQDGLFRGMTLAAGSIQEADL